VCVYGLTIVPDLYLQSWYIHPVIDLWSQQIAKQSQLLSSHAQELPVLRRTPPTPRLAPDTHWNSSGHAQHDHDGVESEDRSVAGGVDEVLQRLRDGEVDARRADGEDDDDLAGNLYIGQLVRTTNTIVRNWSSNFKLTPGKQSIAYAVAILQALTWCAIMAPRPIATAIQGRPLSAAQP
jgi:hypothetical protein